MTHPDYVKQHARRLRTDRHLSIDEIAERLALPKTTIYYWVKDLPLSRERRWSEGQKRAYEANRDRAKAKRDAAYAEGWAEYEALVLRPTFREFVALYVAEGYKRSRNHVAICNSDERMMALSTGWLRRLAGHELTFWLQYHEDHDLGELRSYWGTVLHAAPESIRVQRKSNSGRLSHRQWRSEHGVLTARACDTQLRSRLQAWMDRSREGWRLDSYQDGA